MLYFSALCHYFKRRVNISPWQITFNYRLVSQQQNDTGQFPFISVEKKTRITLYFHSLRNYPNSMYGRNQQKDLLYSPHLIGYHETRKTLISSRNWQRLPRIQILICIICNSESNIAVSCEYGDNCYKIQSRFIRDLILVLLASQIVFFVLMVACGESNIINKILKILLLVNFFGQLQSL